jgi:predicted metal-dependent hydrolase
MAFKEFSLDERTVITVYKRKASRSLRISIGSNGIVRVSIPTWAPYSSGVAFARSKQSWIEAQKRPQTMLQEGQPIGKAHHLRFKADALAAKAVGRLKANEAVVSYPAGLAIEQAQVQKAAQSVSIRALRSQAEALLPQRLASLAATYGFNYRTVSVKQLKSRWGSCLIDYVLLHELTHTQVLQHGPNFWSAMERVLPDTKKVRKSLRQYQAAL